MIQRKYNNESCDYQPRWTCEVQMFFHLDIHECEYIKLHCKPTLV